MKRSKWIVLIVLCSILLSAGCSKVWMSSEYSQQLDKYAALSAQTAQRAAAGELSDAEKTTALVKQAEGWQLFKDARDGKVSE